MSTDDNRVRALGRELIETHDWLRGELERIARELDEHGGTGAGGTPRELRGHCLAFCRALTNHHTNEDEAAFPVLAQRFPELAPVLGERAADHLLVADILTRMTDLLTEVTAANLAAVRNEIQGLSAILESLPVGRTPDHGCPGRAFRCRPRRAGVVRRAESRVARGSRLDSGVGAQQRVVILTSGHGGRRNSAPVTKAAATRPVTVPTVAAISEQRAFSNPIRSSVAFHVTSVPCTTNIPTGRASLSPKADTVMIVAPSGVW
ncbi:hemerythrin domain-containing protein [Nocardia sp. NPDC048505]|uniref:hemerythrin domain-containing protein n=1 Tax=unclassified Nocardia TaxID=2637762 RepID=UPI0034100DAC